MFQRLFGQPPAILAIVRHFFWTVPIVAILGTVSSALEGIGIGLLIPLISTLVENDRWRPENEFLALMDKIASSFGQSVRVPLIGSAIFAFIILKCLVQMLNRTFIAWADGTLGHRIRCAMSERLLQVGYPFFLQHEPGYLIDIISTQSWRAVDAIRAWYSIITATAAALIFALALLLVSWRMFLVVCVGVFLIRLIRQFMSRGLRLLSNAWTKGNNVLGDRMFTLVSAGRLIRIFNQEAREQQRFERASSEVFKSSLAVEVASARFDPVLEIAHTALFVILLVGAYKIGVNIALAVTFLVLLYRMQPHLRAMEEARVTLDSLSGAIREVDWLLSPADKPSPPSGKLRFWLQNEITFDNVSFKYQMPPDSPLALSGVSFSIRTARATALIGPSGAGKSTIVNLLLRLYEPSSGQILVDGTRLSKIDPVVWRANIAFAGQDVEFVDGTIRDNIALGKIGATSDEIETAARDADADGFIRQLPYGYLTEVASRGLNLSAGQRQRIALARALVRGPQLLILDEATNAIDGVSEVAVLEALRRRGGRATTLVISHRTTTLAACEQGVVVDSGRIVEAGPLPQLDWYRKAFSKNQKTTDV